MNTLMNRRLAIMACTLLITCSAVAQKYTHAGCKDDIYALFKAETAFADEDYPDFWTFLHDSVDSIMNDHIISIDMKPCGDLIFSAMDLECDYDYATPPSIPDDSNVRRLTLSEAQMRVGYNGKFFHEETNQWRTESAPMTPVERPLSYNTRLGAAMYKADAWLKDQVFDHLPSRYERANYTPLSSEMYLLPDIDFREISESDSVYVRVDSTNVLIRASEHDTEAVLFAEQLANDETFLDVPAIAQLHIAFEAAFWANKTLECFIFGDASTNNLNAVSAQTPNTHPTSLGIVRLQDKQEIHLIEGGVLIAPAMFQRSASTPTVSQDDVKLIRAVIEEIPRDEATWTVRLDGVTYSGITISADPMEN